MRSRRCRLAAVIVCLVLVGAGVSDAAVTGWTVARLTQRLAAVGVSADRPTDVWVAANGAPVAKAFRYDGTTWTSRSLPKAGGTVVDTITGIQALSPTDVWFSAESLGEWTLHWDGSYFRVVPIPGRYSVVLRDIAALPAGKAAWVVGTNVNFTAPVAYRYNGTVWARVPIPADHGATGLSSVAVRSTTDAWAVGPGASAGGTVAHWDGTVWRRVAPAEAGQPEAVTYIPGTNHVWIVGYQDRNHKRQPFAEYYNGTTWTQVSPPELTAGGDMRDVTASSATDVWAVGEVGASLKTGLAEHWNGKTWSRIAVPSGPYALNILDTAAAVPGSTTVWAAGYSTSVSFDQAQIRVMSHS